MKLRTAYFCKQCNEEVDVEKLSLKLATCPWCGYNSKWASTIIYEWKVEAQRGTPSEKEEEN